MVKIMPKITLYFFAKCEAKNICTLTKEPTFFFTINVK